MSIFVTADLFTMAVRFEDVPSPREPEPPVAMRLMADGVPLSLLVDLASPPWPGTDRLPIPDSRSGTDRTGPKGPYPDASPSQSTPVVAPPG
jgi:hypothetical protein